MKDSARKTTLWLTQGATIAALYVVLTLVFAPISFSQVQVRIAEALTILPMFTSAAIPGLFVGCLIGNLVGGATVLDIVFGSLATFVGAVGGYLLRKNRWLVPIPTILSNTIIIPLVLQHGYGIEAPYWVLAAYIALGEVVGCYILGELLATLLKRYSKYLFEGKLTR